MGLVLKESVVRRIIVEFRADNPARAGRALTKDQKKAAAERMLCHRSLCGDMSCCGCRIRIRLQHEKRDTYYCESFHIYLYS